MGHPILETRFLVKDDDELQALRAILDVGQDDDDPYLHRIYWLDSETLSLVEARFDASLLGEAPGNVDFEVALMPWHELREAPYLIHTQFELPLMLEGRKPFAHFSEPYPSEWFDELIGRFDPYVEAGLIVRRTLRFPFEERAHLAKARGMLEVYFALPGDEWRIDAYLLLRDVGKKTGWNESLEIARERARLNL
jgi:hypothetical protein